MMLLLHGDRAAEKSTQSWNEQVRTQTPGVVQGSKVPAHQWQPMGPGVQMPNPGLKAHHEQTGSNHSTALVKI